MSRETLVLTRADVASLLDLGACIDAVDAALRRAAAGRTPAPASLGVPSAGGGFHVKAALLAGEPSYFAAKVNGNFFDNPARGLPRIQGLIVLSDGAS